MLRHFIVPLEIEGEHRRATLVMDEAGKSGTILLNGSHVCDFTVETPGSVANYFVAEQLVRTHIQSILGLETMPAETGFKTIT